MIHEKDLATSRSEFFRNLKAALRGHDYKIDGDHIVVAGRDRRVDITLSPLPARVLSPLLKLERWKVTLTFTGYPRDAYDAFLASFDKAFQRGGG